MVKCKVVELRSLRDRSAVFSNRREAGGILAKLLVGTELHKPLVLAIPAGGMPVARVLADKLNCPLDVAVVSKITPPWNPEVGYGAVAFDGSHQLNANLVHSFGLSEQVIAQGIARTRAKVERRLTLFRKDRPFPEVNGCDVILVDDGLASGLTMLVALAAIDTFKPKRKMVAVPTGYAKTVEKMALHADAVFCANIRGGGCFAVADAYRFWDDVSETEAETLLRQAWSKASRPE